MLCYRCGSHVADTSELCPTCGQKLAGGGLRQATGTFSRRRPSGSQLEGAPYKPQELVASRYLIKDTVGAGPLGYVFRAHDKEIDVEVALKVINPRLVQTPEERKAFAKVLRGARKLSHPNLVRVYEEGEDHDRPYFTSQFLDGLTLRKIIDLRLQKGQFFTLHEIEPILAQVCAALDGAHKVGPHSDLKPDNVLVLPDLLKVTDFGLGLAMPRLPFVQAMKARKADRYLAPEFIEGGEIDGRADVYSVGVVLGEMLSGLTPDGAIPELSRRNPEVVQGLEGIYRKAVNANPNARQKSAGELLTELRELAKKLAPPPLKAKESAAGANPAARPRTTTGMLQLQPRRDKPPPPVPELPPPPPPISDQNPLPDATQRVDPLAIQSALEGNGKGNGTARDALEAKENREETDVIDSGQFIASLEDDAETKAMAETVAPPSPEAYAAAETAAEGGSRTWLLVVLLVIVGVGLGAGGGYFLIQRQKAVAEEQRKALEEQREAERRAQEEAAAQAANNLTPEERAAVEKAAADKAAVEKAFADRAAAEKALEDKALADKAAADKAVADTAAADKALADKAAADKIAAADKALADKTATDKAAEDKAAADKAAADKAAADKAAADKAAADKAAEDKAVADKAAADKTPTDKAAADKAAADKAAADKAATDKARAEKAAADKARAEKAAADKAARVAAVTVPKAEACAEGMRSVPAGVFKMGTSRDDPMMGFDERALSAMNVSAFCIDLFEYPDKRGVAPTSAVTWQDAQRLCEAQNKRLCSEAEWEKACKGPGGAKWPWGGSFDNAICNTEDDAGDPRSLAGAGRFAKCRSAYGVWDMSGNVAEWTAEKMIKGGSFASGDYAVRCSARKNGTSFAKGSEVGFRCCSDLH